MHYKTSILLSTLLTILMLVPSVSSYAQVNSALRKESVSIMVFGSPHLRYMNLDEEPIATELVYHSLKKFNPDLIVVEWLNPSIPREEAFNYGKLTDRNSLKRLWDYREDVTLEKTFNFFQAQLDSLKALELNTIPTRIELGKLYYLKGDELNAGYQWWIADELGGDVSEVKHLTRNNFKGHELNVWGFRIAYENDLEYITPFDYQGENTGWRVWGKILDALQNLALKEKYNLSESDNDWKEKADYFKKLRTEFEQQKSNQWLDEFGDIKEINEYAEAWNGFGLQTKAKPEEISGLDRIKWWQGKEYEVIEKKVQYELIPGISINGLGQQRTDGNIYRNRKMVEFVESDIKTLQPKRVLVIVGYAHKHFLEDIFREKGYYVIPSASYFTK